MIRRCGLLSALLALASCSGEPPEDVEARATDIPKSLSGPATAASGIAESEYGTPVKDRVATLGLLNKRNNLTQDLVLKSGESKRFGNVFVKLGTCERTAPWERPKETGAFVQVFVEERESAEKPLAWRKIFSGWLFKNSPSLNVVEHPVYDVWVKDCSMRFPGEEEEASPITSASSAPKPSGSDNASPAVPAAAKPAPKPSAPASATPAER